jgi:tetratricopeptide (TPR) repeat protein
MKKKSLLILLALLLGALTVPAAWSQLAEVKGSVKDTEGKPMVGATVEWFSLDTGQKVTMKTDKQGVFFSIGVPSGVYKVTVLSGPGLTQPYVARPKFQVTLSQPNNCDIDLQKELNSSEKQMSPEEKAKREAALKENQQVKGLNAMLNQATQQQTSGDFQGAVATLKQATQADPSRDLLWYRLGDAERLAASKSTDPADKKQLYTSAIQDIKKAISIKPTVAGYYNNLADAQAKTGDTQGAIDSFTKAAQNDPQNAAMYYFNLGAVLTNAGKSEEANAAFDKSIAADPNKADAYYQKGVNLLGKAKVGPQGQWESVPAGTADAFNKYLELQPNGPYAEGAKAMLAQMGAKVETSYGKGKSGKKK